MLSSITESSSPWWSIYWYRNLADQRAQWMNIGIPVVVLLATLFTWFAISHQSSPLRKYPGPRLAAWTNLWRLRLAISANYGPSMKRLHETYGPVVRTGPNLLDIDYPELSKVIYGTDGKWLKSDFYKVSSSLVNGKITYHMFSEVDPAAHARLKRPVVRHFSVPSVKVLEPLMDESIQEFCHHLQQRFVDSAKVFSFGAWLAFFSWDLLGLVTFSRKFGYMAAGCDFDGTLDIADQSIDYLGMCGQMPWLDRWLDKNPIYPLGPPSLSNATRIAIENLTARLKGEDHEFDPEKPDYLQYFIESKNSHPDTVHEGTIIGYLLLNLVAGADTTAITLKAVFYYCLKDQRVWRKLQDEVRQHFAANSPVPVSDARQLPYLEAVVNEALRYHPAVCMTMERIVPEGGLILPNGSTVPAGTMIGMNPYVVGRNKGIFGSDADTFRPDRWLQQDRESHDEFKSRMQRWSKAHIMFGGGSRICLGRHLSLMEVFKLVPTLIATFDIELDDPEEVWWTSSRWFFRTRGIVCRMRPRSSEEA